MAKFKKLPKGRVVKVNLFPQNKNNNKILAQNRKSQTIDPTKLSRKLFAKFLKYLALEKEDLCFHFQRIDDRLRKSWQTDKGFISQWSYKHLALLQEWADQNQFKIKDKEFAGTEVIGELLYRCAKKISLEDKRMALYKKAYEYGHEKAKNTLGEIYYKRALNNHEINNFEDAVQYTIAHYSQAVNYEHLSAAAALSNLFITLDRDNEALSIVEHVAEKHGLYGQLLLAEIYDKLAKKAAIKPELQLQFCEVSDLQKHFYIKLLKSAHKAIGLVKITCSGPVNPAEEMPTPCLNSMKNALAYKERELQLRGIFSVHEITSLKKELHKEPKHYAI